jgi:ABC-2 type transport system permease protein
VIRLLRVELRRLLSRRLVRLLGALVVVGIVTAGVTLLVKSHRPSADGERALIQQADRKRAEAIASCSRGEFHIPPQAIPAGETLSQFCAERVVPPEGVPDPRFHLVNIRELIGTNPPLIILLFVIGASFFGADWHAGTVSSLLVWEPRRIRVFVAKAVALALFAFVAAMVIQALLGAALAPAAIFRGTTEGADAAWFRSVVGLGLRGSVVAMLAALIGFSVASLGRNTAAALGAGFVYLAVLEPILRSVRPKWQPWFLYDNVATFIQGHAADFTLYSRSTTGAAAVIVFYSLALAAISAVAFQRRDIA